MSEQSKHTPGRWIIVHEPTLSTYHVRVESDLDAAPVASLFYSSGGARPQISRERIAANAHLIAAAPDGLAFAKSLDKWHHLLPTEIEQARLAFIARAEGGGQ